MMILEHYISDVINPNQAGVLVRTSSISLLALDVSGATPGTSVYLDREKVIELRNILNRVLRYEEKI